MDEVLVKTKKAILNQKLELVNNTIYSYVIDKQVAVKCKDKAMEDRSVEELRKYTKMKNEYENLLKELDKPEPRKDA
jgi:hypothetical protein